MALITENTVIALGDLPALSAQKKQDGSRFVQVHCVTVDEACFDIIYSWMKDDTLSNYKIQALTPADEVPSITDNFLAAFVFENEAHDLFGANIKNIAIDFQGHFYALSMETPMTVISPEQKAAREKAAKIAAAKAAKEAAAAQGAAAPAEDADAAMEAKLAAMDPEKAAKVRAAMEAKKKKAAAAAASEEKGE